MTHKLHFIYPDKTITYLTLIIFVSLLLYLPSINYFFFQDDWFVLNWVKFSHPFSFFQPRQDIIYYRPLSMPLFFFTQYTIFGLNALAFHAISYSLFIILIISVFKLFSAILGNGKIILVGTFLYSTWAIHFISLSWLSTTSYIIVTLLLVLSLSYFIKFSQNNRRQNYILSFILFFLALLSHEFAIVFPMVLFAWGFILKNKNYFYLLVPFFLTCLLYLIFKFVIFPVSTSGDYELSLNYLVVNNFIWYLLWAFNIPESFKELINQKFAGESIRRLVQFWNISLPTLFLMVIIAKLVVSSLKKNIRIYLFGFTWFCLGLLPIIALANHSYPVYLSFAGIGFVLILAKALSNIDNRFTALLMAIWLVSSIANLKFTRATHWIINEQKISKTYFNHVKSRHLNPPKESAIIFKKPDLPFSQKHNFIIPESSETLKQSLNNQSFAQVFFGDNTIKSYFPEEEAINIPPGTTTVEISPRGTDE